MSAYVYLHRILPKFWSRLLIYLDIQLFLSLCSWPILSVWGLPLSPAGIVGNLLFLPFLSLFLSASSLIFFCELLSIPCGIFILLLETITAIWSTILSQANRSWLFIGAHPPLHFTRILPVIACSMMCWHSLSQIPRILMFSMIYLCCAFIIPRYQQERTLLVPYENKEISICQSQGETLLLDPGIIGRHISAPQKIRYILIPFLITQGIRRVDILVVPKPSLMVFKALTIFIEHFPIATIYLPHWHASAWPNTGWSSWESLLRKAHDYGTTLCIVKTPLTISCGSFKVTLSPSPTCSKRNKLIYHELMLESQGKELLD